MELNDLNLDPFNNNYNLEFIFYFECHLVEDVLGVPWCTGHDPH